jgi:N-acetylneuraminic acid mutarotase
VQTTGTLPSERIAHSAAAIGSKLYVFGGRSGVDIGEGSLNDLYCLDTEDARWSQVVPASGVVPPKRSYHCMAAAQGKLFLFGGCGEGSTGRLNDLWEFDPATAAWRQLPSSDAIKASGCAFASCQAGGMQP